MQWIIATAPEIFPLLAVAIGTVLDRQKSFGLSIDTTACILIVSVILGQLGTFTIPALLKTVLFSLFAPVLGVALPYAVGNVVRTMLGPIIVTAPLSPDYPLIQINASARRLRRLQPKARTPDARHEAVSSPDRRGDRHDRLAPCCGR